MNEALRAKPCPICGKPEHTKLKPFCSARCADVDLYRWFTGAYAVPASDNADAEDQQTTREKPQDGET